MATAAWSSCWRGRRRRPQPDRPRAGRRVQHESGTSAGGTGRSPVGRARLRRWPASGRTRPAGVTDRRWQPTHRLPARAPAGRPRPAAHSPADPARRRRLLRGQRADNAGSLPPAMAAATTCGGNGPGRPAPRPRASPSPLALPAGAAGPRAAGASSRAGSRAQHCAPARPRPSRPDAWKRRTDRARRWASDSRQSPGPGA